MHLLRILLFCPDPLVRATLTRGLASAEWVTVVAQQDGRADWSEEAAIHRADLIVCDIGWQGSLQLPELDDIGVPVLVLAPDAISADSAWQRGARGVVGRGISAETLEQAIISLSHNLSVFDNDLLPTRLERSGDIADNLIEPLTERESEVLNLLARGMTNRAIAHQLQISDHTVKFHVNAVLGKLRAQSRTEAAVRATRLGLVSI